MSLNMIEISCPNRKGKNPIFAQIGFDSDSNRYRLTIMERVRGGSHFDVYAMEIRKLPDGLAFHLARISSTRTRSDHEQNEYDVFMSNYEYEDDPMDSCDCMGFERWGHCKHSDGLRTLLDQGRLDSIEIITHRKKGAGL